MLRVIALLLGLVLPFALSTAVPAADVKPFDPGLFRTVQEAGGPILVDIAASWCPTCKAQKPIIDSLVQDPDFAKLTVLHVDFDTQKDVVRALGATSQSTLIAFRGQNETGRSVGDTNPDSIEALLRSAISN